MAESYSNRRGSDSLQQQVNERNRVAKSQGAKNTKSDKIADLVRRRAALINSGIMLPASIINISGAYSPEAIRDADSMMSGYEAQLQRRTPAAQQAQPSPKLTYSDAPNFIGPRQPKPTSSENISPEQWLADPMRDAMTADGTLGEGSVLRKTGSGYEAKVASEMPSDQARGGFRMVGVSPSLDQIMAARTGGSWKDMTPAERQGELRKLPRPMQDRGEVTGRPQDVVVGGVNMGRSTLNPDGTTALITGGAGINKPEGSRMLPQNDFNAMQLPKGTERAMTINPAYLKPGDSPIAHASGVAADEAAIAAHLATLTGQPAEAPAWQKEVTSKYPNIGTAGTPENEAYVTAAKKSGITGENGGQAGLDLADNMFAPKPAPVAGSAGVVGAPAPISAPQNLAGNGQATKIANNPRNSAVQPLPFTNKTPTQSPASDFAASAVGAVGSAANAIGEGASRFARGADNMKKGAFGISPTISNDWDAMKPPPVTAEALALKKKRFQTLGY